MLQVIINLLTPIFTGMGASAEDVASYVQMCSGYIYAILALLVVMIVVLVVAHWVKKGTRHVVRWSAVLAFLTAVVIVANMVCYGPLYDNVSVMLNGSSVELSEETKQNSRDLVKQLGEEGIVLVKNEGLLPLSSDVKSLNVFGWDSTNPVYGGTGSGDSATAGNVSILQSFADAGYKTNEALSKIYTDYCATRPTVSMNAQDWTLPEPTVDVYTDEVMSNAKDFSDVAVITIGRSGGENADLPTDMNAVIHGTWNLGVNNYTNGTYKNNGDYDDFEPGEHYLELSVTEEKMVEKVCSAFDKVIVIINANNAMELGWVDEYDAIKAVLLAPGAGVSGFAALGEIFNGTVNPSGHTADTYVRDLTKTPYYNNINSFLYNNVSEIIEANAEAPSYQDVISFVDYVEGIYVGYKFYETAYAEAQAAAAAAQAPAEAPAEGEEAAPAVEAPASWAASFDYDEYVMYPFGYGLSYTTFEQKIENFKAEGDNVTFDVVVTNTGDVAGKSVVEVYFTPPYTNGGIEKAAVNLVDYGKTEILAPGASETISFSIPKEDMASYDSACIKTENGGYVLEAGEYVLSIRADSHTVLDEATFTQDADIDYSKDGRASDKQTATNVFESYSNGGVTYLSRANGFANYEEATAAPADSHYVMSDEMKEAIKLHLFASYDPASLDNPDDVAPTLGAQNGLKLADLTGKSYDDPAWDKLLDQLSFDDMTAMICLGGWRTVEIPSVGKVATSDCDGPAGLNNFLTGAQGTAFGTEVLMAQTWNQKLARTLGETMGAEYAEVKNWGWYGPAMNTHRSAFAGRNFEYYSEDGVLAGKFAAQQVNGGASKGVYSYIKHFALNDQEINRCAALLTFSTEQAIREIYLKPFEEVVKNFEYTQIAVMSSFNWIGTVPACVNPDLLTTVLRNEWGFVGMVETDFDGGYGYQLADHCVRTGGDLMLGFNNNTASNVMSNSATALLAMRNACKNILYTVGNSGAYTVVDADEGGMDNMTKLFLTVDIIAGVVILAALAIVLARWAMKNRKAKKAKAA